MVGPKKLRLQRGDLKVAAAAGSPVTVVTPDGQSTAIDDTRTIRVKDGRPETLKRTPRWLAGFEGTAVDESIGSLVALIDGRNEPAHRLAITR